MVDNVDDFINRTTGRMFQNLVALACGRRLQQVNSHQALLQPQTPTTPTSILNQLEETGEHRSQRQEAVVNLGPAHTSTSLTMIQPSLSEEMSFPSSNAVLTASANIELYPTETAREDETASLEEQNHGDILNELSSNPEEYDINEQIETQSNPGRGNENDTHVLPESQLPPLTADFLEIFTYNGEDGEEGSALALTVRMVMSWNGIIKHDGNIDRYSDQIQDLLRERDGIDHKIQEADMNSDSIAGNVLARRDEIQNQLRKIRRKLENTEERLRKSQKQVTRDLKRVLDRYSLLEAMSESDGGSVVSVHYIHQPAREASNSPTPSELQHRDAEEDVKNKRENFNEAKRKIDRWEDYYDDQYKQYREWVDEGNQSMRTFFDNNLMQDYAEAMEELRAAERGLEEARKRCRDFRGIRPQVDQESEFADYPDDGYRESMEAAMVAYIDRGRIERWIEQEDSNDDEVPECDDWKFRPVDITDSASVFADGKARKKIDHWAAICEEIEVEVPEVETSEEVQGPLDFDTLVDADIPEEVQIPEEVDMLVDVEIPGEVQVPANADSLIDVGSSDEVQWSAEADALVNVEVLEVEVPEIPERNPSRDEQNLLD